MKETLSHVHTLNTWSEVHVSEMFLCSVDGCGSHENDPMLVKRRCVSHIADRSKSLIHGDPTFTPKLPFPWHLWKKIMRWKVTGSFLTPEWLWQDRKKNNQNKTTETKTNWALSMTSFIQPCFIQISRSSLLYKHFVYPFSKTAI